MRYLLLLFCLAFADCCAQRPNIIYIMSDDHDRRAISAYIKTFIHTPNIDRIANEGMRFDKAFVGNSICGPARATLLTGQHSHKNGMIDNRKRFDSSKITVAKLLQAEGYQTVIVGKWHLHSYPAGFDYWKILPGQGLYYEPRLISMNGDTSTYHGYATDVITDEALHWLDLRDKTKPFMLLLHHKAPHRNFFAPLKYIMQFHEKHFPEPATLYTDTTGHGTAWNLQTMSILHDMKLSSDLKVDPKYLTDIPWLKPDSAEIAYYNALFNRIPQVERNKIKEIYKERGELLQRLHPKGNELLKYKFQWYMQDYLACVASVDENVGRVLNYLDKKTLTKNTLIIYTSDQGMYLGQNGWFDKRWMYDVSMRTPFLMRWPGHIKPKSVNTSMVQNIDFAPTFLQAANVKVPGWMQGIGLVPLITGKQKTLSRKELYYHFYEYSADHTVLPHLGVRGERYKLIYFYTVNEWELYDLQTDPQEQKNLIHRTAYKPVLATMKKELLKQRDLYDDHEPAGELK
ncbi:MAG TPA: sulfatase [Chitinophagaceae bacterium]|nr:sulfatase [Chitinophagaceae bacterium]